MTPRKPPLPDCRRIQPMLPPGRRRQRHGILLAVPASILLWCGIIALWTALR